ncbi:hypothetical protein, partial [Pseudomonas sp. FSL R10-2172]|uniref:hypothetical protein n=1 Tax=Pseudomonas sp. FSL R10-2172 TaxID=2662198 RepID=UPI001C49B25C
IGGMRGSFPRLANLHAQSSNRHVFAFSFLGPMQSVCLTRREGRVFLVEKRLSAPLINQRIPQAVQSPPHLL